MLFGIFPDRIVLLLNALFPEKTLGDSVKLRRDSPEVLVQIQRTGTDLIPAQIENTVRRDGFLRFRVDQHSGDFAGMLHILILHIGIDLIEVRRMQRSFIELLLHGLAVIFGVQNQNFIMIAQPDIRLHGREKPGC